MQHDPSDRLDVLLLLGALQLRGSYARAMALLNRVPQESVRLRLVATEAPRHAPHRPEVRFVRSLNWPVVGRVSRSFLRTDLCKNPPDLIDIQHRFLHHAGAWLARHLQRPYLLTVHDYLRDRERLTVDLRWCRRIVAVSESVRSELLERTRLPEDLVTVISGGIEPPDESLLAKVLDEGRCPVIGTAGPLEPQKGLQFFLQAAVRVLQRRPDALFVIAGSGPQERTLRRQAANLGLSHALTILPNLRDFGPALRAMDIFVLPALKQGFGSTLLDAMAHGLPVIGTESGGVYSLVVDGETGFLVPPADETALAERIVLLLEDPERARALGAAARARVMQHFHVHRMVESTTALYQDVVREHGSASHSPGSAASPGRPVRS